MPAAFVRRASLASQHGERCPAAGRATGRAAGPVSYHPGRFRRFRGNRETRPFLTIQDNPSIWLGVRPVGAKRESVTHVACKWPLLLAPLPDGITGGLGRIEGVGHCESVWPCGPTA